MESDQISPAKKKKLKKIYLSLNPAQLKRTIEANLDNLYRTYQQKQRSTELEPFKRLTPRMVSKYIAKHDLLRCPT